MGAPMGQLSGGLRLLGRDWNNVITILQSGMQVNEWDVGSWDFQKVGCQEKSGMSKPGKTKKWDATCF